MKQKNHLLATAFLLCAACSFAQLPTEKKAAPYIGSIGVKMKLSELKTAKAHSLKEHVKDRQHIQAELQAPLETETTLSGTVSTDEALADAAMASARAVTANRWSNFLSVYKVNLPGQARTVPDPSGAVGPTQVVVATNMGIRVFLKPSVTGTPVRTPSGYSINEAPALLSIDLNDFFSAILPDSSAAIHPYVRYDRLSKRWFVLAVEEDSARQNNRIMLAVSDGDQITDTSGFTFYAFDYSQVHSNANAATAPYFDVPTFGIDRYSVLIGGAQFNVDSVSFVGYVINKRSLLRGQLVLYPFALGAINNVAGVANGMAYPAAVNNDDPSAKRSFFIGTVVNRSLLNIAALDYDNALKPFVAYQTNITTPDANFPRDIGSLGALAPVYTFPIDARRVRVLQAGIFKNKRTGISSLWTAQTVGVNQSGGFIPLGLPTSNMDYINQARNASRWYEIKDIYTQAPMLKQTGAVFDSKQSSGRRAIQYFNATIASNGQGSALINGTTTAYNASLNVFAAGRSSTDAPGFIQEPVKITRSNAIYTPFFIDRSNVSVANRGLRVFVNGWGDYSQTVVDPLDDQTFWTFQEYANVDDGYGIRAVQFKAPPPATPASLGVLSNTSDTTLVITGNPVNGAGFFDPGKDEGGPGYNRLSVKSTGDILVRNIKLISPTKISVRINVKSKPAGNYQLIITNPDGQIAVADYSITVASPTVANNAARQHTLREGLANAAVIKSNVFPNPTSRDCILQINAAKGFSAKIVLADAGGKQLYEKSLQLGKGANQVEMSIEKLAGGTYFARVYNNENKLVVLQKIVKQ